MSLLDHLAHLPTDNVRAIDHDTWTQLAPLVLGVDPRLAECPARHHVHLHPEDYLASILASIGRAPAPAGNPIHDQLVVDLAVAQVPEVLAAILRDRQALAWRDQWRSERETVEAAMEALVVGTDCCACCYAAVERGEAIGHTPGPGACPYPPCNWHQP